MKRSRKKNRKIPFYYLFRALHYNPKMAIIIFAIQRYHLSAPMRGTWFTNPLGQSEVDRLFPVMR